MSKHLTIVVVVTLLLSIGAVSAKSKLDPLASKASNAPLKISLSSPKNNAKVWMRPKVKGTVTDTKANVIVVVHPIETSDYWVQPSASVTSNGSWSTSIYIGREGSVDVGKGFEIMAFANPKGTYSEGDVLSDWPKSKARSEKINVTRKKG